MIANYDAEAIAEVMGLAFLRRAPEKRASRPGGFVIADRDDSLEVVFDKRHRPSPRRSAPSPVLMERAVEHGLPRPVLRHVAEQLAGDDKSKVAALEWVVVPRTTLERRETQLSPQESERTERVARLFVHANRALGTKAEAREFMTTPHPQLDGRSPLDAARTDLGTRRVEQILNALEYGLAL